MKNFYRKIKYFYGFAAFILLITLIPISYYNAKNDNWTIVYISFAVFGLMIAIEVLILLYYRNIVIEVAFEGNYSKIKTNSKVYILPSKHFMEVNDSISRKKIFLLYFDGEIKKKFVFQKKYSQTNSYSLDLQEMKKHMTSAIFKET